jgi:hypothetical protein
MAKRRGGRPSRPPEPGERVVMSFRVTPDLKARLDQAAEQTGRSLTQDIELRLQQSFDLETLLGEPSARTLTVLHILCGLATFETGGKDWLDDPAAFTVVLNRWIDELERLGPRSSVTIARRVEKVREAIERLGDDNEPVTAHRRRIAAVERYASDMTIPYRVRIEAEIAARAAWAKLESLIPADASKVETP